jgi:hypothetical protein
MGTVAGPNPNPLPDDLDAEASLLVEYRGCKLLTKVSNIKTPSNKHPPASKESKQVTKGNPKPKP